MTEMSQRSKPNVKTSTSATAKGSSLKVAKVNAISSKTDLPSLFFLETMEKIQPRRPTLKLESQSMYYEKLRVTSSLQFFRHEWGGITAMRYLQDCRKIAVGFNHGDLLVCTPVAQNRSGSFETVLKGKEENDCISCIQFHPKKPNFLYASSTAGTVMRRDLEDSNNYNDFFISEEGNEIYSMDFTSSCELVTVGRDATVRMYDVTTEKLLSELGQPSYIPSVTDSLASSKEECYHRKRIYCVRCHPSDPSVFVSGGWDGVRVWDLRVRKAARTIVGPFIFGDTIDICKGMVLTASCEARNCLQLWDLGSGLLIDDINPSNKNVYLYGHYPYVARFYKGDPTGDLVLYGVGGLQLISVKESSILYLFEDDKPARAVDSADKKFAFGGKSNTVLYGKISLSESDALSLSSLSHLVLSTQESDGADSR